MATEKYTEAVGRRKTSVARVRLTPAAKLNIEINGKEFDVYFPTAELRKTVTSVFETEGVGEKFKVTAKLVGGGISSQAQALRHGIARAIIEIDSHLRSPLKAKGYLKRDPRSVERKKFGLKKARKSPTWSKR